MSEKEKKGRKAGLWLEIIVLVLLIGLSMMLGIRLYCKDWLNAVSYAIWIACWVVWYKIWKDSMRNLYENRHLKEMLHTTVASLVTLRKIMDDDEEDDDKKGDNANAEANKDNNEPEPKKPAFEDGV